MADPARRLPTGRVCHLTAGRLRLKIPERRGQADYFAAVEGRLRGWRSIDHVEANPLTGSVLVRFTDINALFAENAVANDLFEVEYDELVVEPGPVTEQAAAAFQAADDAVRRWTGNAAELRGAIFVTLLIGGIYQLLRGNIAAPAATLLWYAGATLRLWDTAPAVPDGVAETRPTDSG